MRCRFDVSSSLYGDNTDWQGIRFVVQHRLPRSSVGASDVGVVMGAGGTARAAIYALQQMGFADSRIVLFNPRTTAKAKQLANEFKVNCQLAQSTAGLLTNARVGFACSVAHLEACAVVVVCLLMQLSRS